MILYFSILSSFPESLDLEYFDLACYLTRKDERAQAKSIIKFIDNTITEEEIDKIIDWNSREINKLTSDFLERAQHIYYFEDFIASDKPITEFVKIINESLH